MKARFYADKRSKGDFVNLILSISHDYKKSNRSTGLSVPKEIWDTKNHWVKGNSSYSKQTRDKLLAIKDFIESLELPSAKAAAEAYDREYKKVKVLPKEHLTGLVACIKAHADMHEKKYAWNVIRKYRKTAENLELYCNQKNLSDDINQMSADEQRIFFSGFVDFLCYEEVKIKDKVLKSQYKNSTMKKSIDNIKTVCSSFEDLNLKIKFNRIINSTTYRTAEQKAAYCTTNEIMQIYNKECEGIEEEVRDIAIFSAFTGLRHNELYSVKESNISIVMVEGHKVPVLSHIQNKSKKRNNIPLNSICLEIINKYRKKSFDAPKKYNKGLRSWETFDECLLPVRSNQKCNKYLHRICRALKIDDPYTEVKYSGNNKIETTRPKWQAITFHSMRHSFAYYMKEKGYPDGAVAELMGIDESTYKNNYRHSFGSQSILLAHRALEGFDDVKVLGKAN